MPKLNRFFIITALLISAFSASTRADSLPTGFVYLDEMIPDIELDMRYYGNNNFIGRQIDGYRKPRCIISRDAAKALSEVQKELRRFSLGLKVFDAYRPQRAVDHFVRWSQNPHERETKTTYYPDIAKSELFKQGYIASKSGHSRGSTVDLTLVGIADSGQAVELDMGSPYDFFGPVSWVGDTTITAEQRAHRMLLQQVMAKHGFKPYPKEWWHFTLADEPFPETYFNFPIQ